MGVNLASVSEKDLKRMRNNLVRHPKTDCLLFSGNRDRDGYGQLKIQRRTVKVHRLAFVAAGGVLTEDQPFVLHRCDQPACCNPEHLFAGSNAENLRDMATKGRGVRSKRGHPYGATPYLGAWQSQAKIAGRNTYVGRFSTWQEASARAFLAKNLALFPDVSVN